MRHYQRGIATLIILIIFLMVGIAIVSAYFVFQQQKAKAVKSFEDCAKLYPVMESYPAQCNTPDGKHFVQQISEEEKEKLEPVFPPSLNESQSLSSGSTTKAENGWITYKNTSMGIEFQYPPNAYIKEENQGKIDLRFQWRPKGQNLDVPIYFSRSDRIQDFRSKDYPNGYPTCEERRQTQDYKDNKIYQGYCWDKIILGGKQVDVVKFTHDIQIVYIYESSLGLEVNASTEVFYRFREETIKIIQSIKFLE